MRTRTFNIATEEYAHIELVAYAINRLLTGTTARGKDPSATPLSNAVDARNTYHNDLTDLILTRWSGQELLARAY